ncbi:hypothetical protein PBAC_01400 [Pedobacter glucosidilyticus]|nr:hypothetical protein [Pedobacter glucosidilyticus]KHJ39629.1 hypothetical protein PBAC_01400 [Pedobacter glucosidilyticus]
MYSSILSLEEWHQISLANGVDESNHQPTFVQIVEISYNLKALPYVVYYKNEPVLGVIVYTNNKNIIHPSQYFYTAIWENTTSKYIIQNAYLSLIKDLKSAFKNIRFRFSPEVIDIRPFIVNKFKPTINYTYYNYLSSLDYNSKIITRERKSANLGILFNWDYKPEIIHQNIKALKNIGYAEKELRPLKRMMELLYKEGFLIGVSATNNNVILGSALIMINKNKKTAMNVLITSEKQNYDTGLHSALYLNIFKKLKENDYLINDLYGANMLGIGNFKANFGGVLKPHYTVEYRYFEDKIKGVLKGFFK